MLGRLQRSRLSPLLSSFARSRWLEHLGAQALALPCPGYVAEGRPLDVATEAALKADGRAGAMAILDAVARRRFAQRSEGQRLRKLLRFESEHWQRGLLHVAGVDEAGMSPLAGPVWRR